MAHPSIGLMNVSPALALVILASLALPRAHAQPGGASDIDAAIRMNQVQVVGSHNSYKAAIEPRLMAWLEGANPGAARSLDYSHPPLAEQLALGLRNLELDVFYDPEGGRYAEPLGLAQLASSDAPASAEPYDPDGALQAPGYKVLHVQDIDFRSTCLTLQACLREVRTWSEANPGHLPIIITVNAKDAPLDVPGAAVPLPFDAAAADALDAEIRVAFPPDALITPDDVRGGHETLEAAVRAHAWPTLAEARGRVLFVLDEGGEKLEAYRRAHPSLRGRAMFANAHEGTPEAAVRIVNDPVGDAERIRRLVADGYLVRTRADAGTEEARTGDTARRAAAFASGAHVVTTDYYRPNPAFGTGYAVQVPGGGYARCHPTLAPDVCEDDRLEP